ncbi:GntR family transcriptional regulator [Parasalinivibrio latis]|uniref:GntR family transcriptional regulator n=1 Tax=Parasalinivibrio latis TaxID=2952610 RepID=UPI0030DFE43C
MGLYETLRSDILMGVFEPGSKLKMETLKERYKSGVNVLRESLARLSSEGLVNSEGQKGFSVAQCSIERMEELTRLRVLLESDGARQSFAKGDMEWESNLVAAHHKLVHIEGKMRQDTEAHFWMWHQCDYQFHAALIAACGSTLHMHYHRQIYDQFRQFVVAEIKTNGFRGTDIVDEHALIMEAALSRNIEACVSALEAHLGGFVMRLKNQTLTATQR